MVHIATPVEAWCVEIKPDAGIIERNEHVVVLNKAALRVPSLKPKELGLIQHPASGEIPAAPSVFNDPMTTNQSMCMVIREEWHRKTSN